MHYQPLCSISLSHDYYADGRCLDLEIEPTPESAAWLKGHRMVVKKSPKGLTVLAPWQDNNQGSAEMLVEPDFPFDLNFALKLTNPDFVSYTHASDLSFQTNLQKPTITDFKFRLDPEPTSTPGLQAHVLDQKTLYLWKALHALKSATQRQAIADLKSTPAWQAIINAQGTSNWSEVREAVKNIKGLEKLRKLEYWGDIKSLRKKNPWESFWEAIAEAKSIAEKERAKAQEYKSASIAIDDQIKAIHDLKSVCDWDAIWLAINDLKKADSENGIEALKKEGYWQGVDNWIADRDWTNLHIQQNPPVPFGWINIHWENKSAIWKDNSHLCPSPNFKLTFSPKEHYWLYYLISKKNLNGNQSYQISYKQPQASKQSAAQLNKTITFQLFHLDKEKEELSKQLEPKNSLKQWDFLVRPELEQRFPDKQILVFLSEQSIPCTAAGHKGFQLKHNLTDSNAIIDNLPNPPPQKPFYIINALTSV